MPKNEKSNRQNFSDLWNRPGFLIRRLHQVHVAIFMDECSEFDVTPAQFAVLTVLYFHGTLDQVSISSQIGFDRNTVADVVRRLEQRGLLERPPSVSDKRAKLACITNQGRVFVDTVQPAMIEAQHRLVKPLNDEEYNTLMTLMDKLLIENNEASRAPLRTRDKKTAF
jgi:DNA-binding MarR family transcriptional regulator